VARSKYPGALAKRGLPPVPGGSVLAPTSQEALAEAHAKRLEYVLQGFSLLCEHYGIDEPDPAARFFLLALALASEHVPYFQPNGKPRGKRADRANGFDLALAVAAAKRKGAATDTDAIAAIQRAGKFKRQHADNLRKKLDRARKDPLVAIFLRVTEGLPQYRGGEGYAELIDTLRSLGQET
jgi:hypothetical protein